MSFQPNTVLYAAQLNAAFARKADLDTVTGKVRADQLPDLVAIADAAVDARMPAIEEAIADAQSVADTALANAATADAKAATADGKAMAAQARANQGVAAAAAAQAAADAAQSDADAAQATADQGVAAAAVADGKAVAAQGTADQAVAAAAAADAKADAAMLAAQAAQATADQGVAAAAVADGKAVAAQGTADQAVSAAGEALAGAAGAAALASAAQALAAAAIPASEKGAANGVASLAGDGKVPLAQLPPLGGQSRVKAWVNFDGNGVIRSAENVSSITVLTAKGSGNYRINFASPMPTVDFACTFGGKFGDNADDSTMALISEPRSTAATRSVNHLDVCTTWQGGFVNGTSAFSIHTTCVAVFA